MSDPALFAALFLLVYLVESSPYLRLPIGLLLAIGALAGDLDVLAVALAGTAAMLAMRITLALRGRAERSRSTAAEAQRDQFRAYLASSPSYARVTFLLAALPGLPSTFLFPLLGTMRAPLGPAVVGTIVGRLPILMLTTALFVWAGNLLAGGGNDPAVALAIFAAIMLVFRSLGLIDWQHRSATGKWRLIDPDANVLGAHPMFSAQARPPHGASPFSARPHVREEPPADDDDVVEGEILGEEYDDHTPAGDPSDPRSITPPSHEA